MKSHLSLAVCLVLTAGSALAQSSIREAARAAAIPARKVSGPSPAPTATAAPATQNQEFRNRVLTNPSNRVIGGDRGGNGTFSPERFGGDRGGNGETGGPLLSNIMYNDMSHRGAQGYICGERVQIAEFVDWMINEPVPLWEAKASVKEILDRVIAKVRNEAPISALVEALEFTAYRIHLIEAGHLPQLRPSPIPMLPQCSVVSLVSEAIFEPYSQALVFSSPYMNRLDNMNKAGMIVSTILRSIIIDANRTTLQDRQINRLVGQFFTDSRLSMPLMRNLFRPLVI